MIARLTTGRSIKGALTYNETKVKEGTAKLLDACNFYGNKNDLSFEDKAALFKSYTERNTRAKVNAFHFSLNFHKDDVLSPYDLSAIADKFMEGVGFGEQPYLVYQHHDSGHPHLHIVSTNIKEDGKRITDSKIGLKTRRLAEDIEKEYRLIFTGSNVMGHYQYPEHNNNIKPVSYPDKHLRNTISNIITEIDNNYSYQSFEDYNKLLNFFNLKAVRLKSKEGIGEQVDTYGLMFQALKKGREIGVPIYASELLYIEKFSAQKLDQKIAAHTQAGILKHLEQDIRNFLKMLSPIDQRSYMHIYRTLATKTWIQTK